MYSITLQTSDTIVVSGDRLGQVQFAASNESDGAAAIDVAGSVFCQAEGAFQSASNPTSMIIATAAADSSAAVGRIKVTDKGHTLPMADDVYDMGNPSFQYRNGYFSEGIVLSSNTPSVTTNKLYNDNGTLKFNGSSIGGSSPGGDVTGTPSGVAFFDDDGTITDDIAGLVFNKTSNSLGINGVPSQKLDIHNGSIRIDSNYAIEWAGSNNRIRGISGGAGAGRIEFIVGGFTDVMAIRAPSAGGTGGVIIGATRDTDYKFEVVGDALLKSSASSETSLTVQGAASQSANLTEWKNSSDTELVSISSKGEMELNVTATNSAREVLFKAKVSDSVSSFGISNLTKTNNRYLPAFYGYNDDTPQSALGFVGLMASSEDDSVTDIGVIDFNCAKIGNANTDPMNASRSAIGTKVLLTVRNNASRRLTIEKDGDMIMTGDLYTSGVNLADDVPTNKSQMLYNDNNQLNFNASGIPFSEPISLASGVNNMMLINSGDYSSITPDANTLYFIVDP